MEAVLREVVRQHQPRDAGPRDEHARSWCGHGDDGRRKLAAGGGGGGGVFVGGGGRGGGGGGKVGGGGGGDGDGVQCNGAECGVRCGGFA